MVYKVLMKFPMCAYHGVDPFQIGNRPTNCYLAFSECFHFSNATEEAWLKQELDA